ncbi:uncharacterized protein LOC124411830 [Diprion similis]|uniref:uncharacterized protein LOC124411830 n=1 Tax=Diprion similis TaxID=362088 RepID=UPI001EF80F67|nr:uncharacterized protein LOC124411830 [Diprion similis]
MASSVAMVIFWSFLSLSHGPISVVAQDQFVIKEMKVECRRLMCGGKSRCVYRRSWCRSPPCPGMVFCSKEENSPVRIPSSCDSVRCSRSYHCSTRYVKDQRTGLNTDIRARCIAGSELKFQAASCAGFKCPGVHLSCILREPKCRGFPCRVLQACIPEDKAVRFHAQCIHTNCSSPDHCFLRQPQGCTTVSGCSHDVACLHRLGDKFLHPACRGVLCSGGSKCEPVFKPCITGGPSCNARPGCTSKFGNTSIAGHPSVPPRVTPGIPGIPEARQIPQSP